MPRRSRSLRQRLWWFNVVYPVALAAVLFTSLTYIVYQGQRQWRLAQQAEKRLLEFSLRHAGEPSRPERGQVLAVSAGTRDLAQLGRAPSGQVPEASAGAYAKVIEALGNAGVPLVFIHWDTEAHPQDEVYLLPLIETLKRLPETTKVFLVTAQGLNTPLPQSLRDLAPLLNEELCEDVVDLQVECSYLPDYKDWVIQEILNELGEKDVPEAAPRPWVSTQLSSVFPRFILNLSPPDAIATVSFSDLIKAAPAGDQVGTMGDLSRVKIALVGDDQSGAVSSNGSGIVIRQVATIYDGKIDVAVTGTPLHVFWAMVAQMYLEKDLIAVPPQRVIIATTVAFCILIAIVMSLFGGAAALGMFLVYVAAGPYVNALAIRHLALYLPLFDSYYFGLSTFIVVGLQKLSATTLARWRLDAQQRVHAHLADLKGNFISLLSHNLNTPVAKMQGMLSLLSGAQAAAAPAAWQQGVRTAEELVTELEYSIRSVLIASALEEGAVHETMRTAKSLASEFQDSAGPSLKRLGITVLVSAFSKDDEDLVHVPLNFDVRAVLAAVAAAAALFYRPGQPTTVAVTFQVEEGEDEIRERLVVVLASLSTWIDASAERVLNDADRSTVRSLTEGTSFFSDILAGLTALAAKAYLGKVVLHRQGPGGRLELTLNPARTLQKE